MVNEVLKFEESWYDEEIKKPDYQYLAKKLYEMNKEHSHTYSCQLKLRNVIIELPSDKGDHIVTLYFSRKDWGKPEIVCTLDNDLTSFPIKPFTNTWKITSFHIDASEDAPIYAGVNMGPITNFENFLGEAATIIVDFFYKRYQLKMREED